MIIEIQWEEKAANDSDFEKVLLALLWFSDVDLKGFSEVINVEKHFSADLFEGSLIFERFILLGQDFFEFLHDERWLLRCEIEDELGWYG